MTTFDEWVDEWWDGEELIVFDNLDEAIVGIVRVHTLPPRVVYDYEKVIEIFMRDNDWTHEEAVEWFEFNVACAWVGEATPESFTVPTSDCIPCIKGVEHYWHDDGTATGNAPSLPPVQGSRVAPPPLKVYSDVMIVAFDVDGTLINDEDQPRWPVIDILRAFHAMGWKVAVWSGSGADYAAMWVRRLGIEQFVGWVGDKGQEGARHVFNNQVPDVAFDDMDVTLGWANVKLPLYPY